MNQMVMLKTKKANWFILNWSSFWFGLMMLEFVSNYITQPQDPQLVC